MYNEQEARIMVQRVVSEATGAVAAELMRRVEMGTVSRFSGMLLEERVACRKQVVQEVCSMVTAMLADKTRKEDETARLALAELDKRLRARFGVS